MYRQRPVYHAKAQMRKGLWKSMLEKSLVRMVLESAVLEFLVDVDTYREKRGIAGADFAR